MGGSVGREVRPIQTAAGQAQVSRSVGSSESAARRGRRTRGSVGRPPPFLPVVRFTSSSAAFQLRETFEKAVAAAVAQRFPQEAVKDGIFTLLDERFATDLCSRW